MNKRMGIAIAGSAFAAAALVAGGPTANAGTLANDMRIVSAQDVSNAAESGTYCQYIVKATRLALRKSPGGSIIKYLDRYDVFWGKYGQNVSGYKYGQHDVVGGAWGWVNTSYLTRINDTCRPT
jgi:hypothetical protein